jgi:hypothetical protein
MVLTPIGQTAIVLRAGPGALVRRLQSFLASPASDEENGRVGMRDEGLPGPESLTARRRVSG